MGQLVAMRTVSWRRLLTKDPAWQAFVLGGYFLLLGASQLAVFPGTNGVFKWVRLLTGMVLVLVGVLQLRTGVTLRRKRRAELLRAIATLISAVERRRRADQG